MSLDLLCLGALAAGAALGAWSGAIRQVVHLVTLVAAALAGPHLAPFLEPTLARVVPARAAPHAAVLAGLILALVAAKLVGRLALRLLEPDAERSAADRGVGALVGLLQGAAAAWVLLSVFLIWDRPLLSPPYRLDPRDGKAAAWVREHNLLDWAAPGESRDLRARMQHLQQAFDGKALDQVRDITGKARAADEARRRELEQVEKAGK